jgi:hypothetical protein
MEAIKFEDPGAAAREMLEELGCGQWRPDASDQTITSLEFTITGSGVAVGLPFTRLIVTGTCAIFLKFYLLINIAV